MAKKLLVLLAAAILVAQSTFTAGAAATPEQSCESGKNKAAGKYWNCRQKAEAKLVTSGDTVKYNDAIAKCEAKLLNDWQKLESKAASKGATCPDGADTEPQFKVLLDQCSSDVTTGLGGGGLPSCPADLTNCTSNLATCVATLGNCGNLVKDGVEACDGADLGGASCTDFGYGGGTLACDAGCELVTAGCTPATLCGNAMIDGTEQCDQGNLNTSTCVSAGFAGGTLACGASCLLDTSGCYNPPRFVDNANGTITDREQAVMWEKKIKLDTVADPANLHDADNAYSWAGTCTIATTKYCQPTAASAAACSAGADGPATGCAQCNGGSEGSCNASDTVWTWLVALNGATFAGHGDWRIPRRTELEGIVDYADTSVPMINVAFDGSSCGGSCTNLALPACSCTDYAPFWTSQTFPNPTTKAYYVDFNDGVTNLSDEANVQYVRAVRSLP